MAALIQEGDYWLYEYHSNKLKQLGKGRPASSLMFLQNFLLMEKKYVCKDEYNLYVETWQPA
jgi:dipeptidyl-peptidase-4